MNASTLDSQQWIEKLHKKISKITEKLNTNRIKSIFENTAPKKSRLHMFFKCPWIHQKRPYIGPEMSKN